MKRRLVQLVAFISFSTSAFAVLPVEKTEQREMKGARPGVSPFVEHVLRPKLVIRKDLSFGLESESQIAFDATSGQPRVVPGTIFSKYSLATLSLEEMEKVARQVVSENPSIFGVKAENLKVNPSSVLIDADDQLLALNIFSNNLQIEDASILFRFKRGKLASVNNSTYAEAESDNRDAVANLSEIARASVLGTQAIRKDDSLRVVESGTGFKTIRVANFVVTGPAETFLVQVERASGKIFEIKSSQLALTGNVKANVYSSSYLDQQIEAPMSHLALAGANRETDESGSFEFASLNSIAVPSLKGKFVQILNQTGTTVGARNDDFSASNQLVFDYIDGVDRAGKNKQVAQLMSYYHLDRVISTARKYINIPWFNQPLVSNVNVANMPRLRCNAYWDRESATINLIEHSDGLCSNAALVADISYHEWGHGLHQNAGGIKDKALSEGFGDSVALLMTKSAKLGKGFILDGRLIRNAEEVVTYPDTSGDPHQTGMALSGSMWELSKALRAKYGDEKGTDILAKLTFKMIFTAVRITDAYQAVLAVDDDNADLSDGTPNYCLINAAFASRRLATADLRNCHR